MTSMHLILTNRMSSDNAGVNDAHQEMTIFRSAQGGVKGIPRRNAADFRCTAQVHGSGLSSQKEMMSPREGGEGRGESLHHNSLLRTPRVTRTALHGCLVVAQDCLENKRCSATFNHTSTSIHRTCFPCFPFFFLSFFLFSFFLCFLFLFFV